MLGHEDVSHLIVMTRGAPKPRRVPRVDHSRLRRGEEELAHQRPTVGAHERLAVIYKRGARDVPACVARSARQLPAAADPVAAVDGFCHAFVWPEIPCRDRRRVAEDLARALRREHPSEGPVGTADHRAPAGRAVGVRHLLNDTEERQRLDLGAANSARYQQVEDAGVAERVDHAGWDRPRAIDDLALLADHLRQRADGRDRIWRRARGIALRAHGCPFWWCSATWHAGCSQA